MAFQLTLLPTDALIYLLFIAIIGFAIWAYRYEHLRAPWREVIHRRIGMAALVVLIAYVCVGLLDSIHLRLALPKQANNDHVYYAVEVKSLLDILVAPLGQQDEESYSAPFATHLYTQSIIELPNGTQIRDYPRLRYGGKDLVNPATDKMRDILQRVSIAVLETVVAWLIFNLLLIGYLAHRQSCKFSKKCKEIYSGNSFVAWREILITSGIILLLILFVIHLATEYHILGTDKVGKDVFYEAIKSIRTGLIIGTLTTLIMLPFAVLLGMVAGYFGGWMDDIIQYTYTTLSSIPAVLLITASILALQIYIENHPQYFPTLDVRADIRLLALCVILGITSWTSLCRLLRGETLKLREVDFVNAAISLGSTHAKILTRHILPNVMHIILITIVLDFSGLVLAEAVLSYVGVGVDPSMISWGNMINSARLELAREPIVWWPLFAAFIFMFTLVLAANLFADAVRDAFDPRLKNI